MATVGVRELKNRLSHYLELARKGERITVTARGRNIAVILPAARSEEEERLMRLCGEGQASWRVGKKPVGASQRVRVRGRPLSELILEDRW